ncbi:MAG: adenylate/guanylate cyclase domain-containing protein [Planctomycetota bacterium]
MLELVVIGPEPDQRWRRPLPSGRTIRIGRAVTNGWAIPWDKMISREHADLRLSGQTLHVRCLDRALNAAELDGEEHRELEIRAGQRFLIGETWFQIDHDEPSTMPGTSCREHAFARRALRDSMFRDAEARLQVLTDLPAVVSQSARDDEFAQRLAELLLDGIPKSHAAAVVQCNDSDLLNVHAPRTMRWVTRSDHAGGFHPSRRLISSSLERGESILHVWADDASNAAYTVATAFDWAFCTPVLGKASDGWCLYVTGKRSEIANCEEDIEGDVRFAELLAEITASIREVHFLQRQQRGLCEFFSPTMVDAMSGTFSMDALEPRECDVTVMFCDLRGFSRMSEEGRDDLHGLLERSRLALGVMTEAVFAEGGVIADFQGDAVLGFWGWPVDEGDGRCRAARAALAIQHAFAEARATPDHPLGSMRVGIGITHGRAIAGKIGTPDQAKVGVFGPVVNVGSRLEGLTKATGTTILTDAACAHAIREQSDGFAFRFRSFGAVQPYGMQQVVDLVEVLPSSDQPEAPTDEELTAFERARELFASGAWADVRRHLESCPADAGPRTFLERIMERLGEPPATWDGTIVMHEK